MKHSMQLTGPELHFFQVTQNFVDDHPPAELCHHLSRLMLEFLRHELAESYPAYVNEFLPDIIALMRWLDEAAKFQKLTSISPSDDGQEQDNGLFLLSPTNVVAI